MPECHTCKYDGEKSRRCLKCKGPAERHRDGQNIVSMDALVGLELSASSSPVPAMTGLLAHCGYVLAAWMNLPAKSRDLVAWRLANPYTSLRVYARRHRTTVQTIHLRLKAAREEWPALKQSIPMRLLQDGRKAPRTKSKRT